MVENIDDLTLGLVKAAKLAVHGIDVASSVNVKKSWGEPLDEMEALAYLVGDAVHRMLIDTEARTIGRELERQLKAAKEESEKLRGNAAARRSKARKSAERDAAKEAGLAARLAAIDEELTASRVALWSHPLKKVAWPPARSVIAPGPAPVHWRTQARAKAEESDEELPETGEEAEGLASEANIAAEAAEAAAEAALLKTERSMKKLSRIPGRGQRPQRRGVDQVPHTRPHTGRDGAPRRRVRPLRGGHAPGQSARRKRRAGSSAGTVMRGRRPTSWPATRRRCRPLRPSSS